MSKAKLAHSFTVLTFFSLAFMSSAAFAQTDAFANKDAADNETLRIERLWVDDRTGNSGMSETWYATPNRFSRKTELQIEVCDGTYYWKHVLGSKTAVRSKTGKRKHRYLDRDFKFPENRYDRLPDEDHVVDGTKLMCYSHKHLAPYLDGPQRMYVYVDPDNRIVKQVNEKFKNEEWILLSEETFRYNVEPEAGLFEFTPGPNVEVIDVGDEADKLIGLKDCLVKKTVKGFVYAVHQAHELEDGGVMLFVSIRPESEMIKSRSARLVFDSGFVSRGGYRIRLGEFMFASVHAQWFFLLPGDEIAPHVHKLSDGTISIRDTFDLRDRLDDTATGHSTASISLAVKPSNPGVSISVADAARKVYQDQKDIQRQEFMMRLDTGIQKVDDVFYSTDSSIDRTTMKEFVDATQKHLEYWHREVLGEGRDVD